MVQCGCGKVLDKVPVWLGSVTVEFICNNCPNRKTKNIAFITLEADGPVKDQIQAPEDLEAVVDEDED
jgi:hypothetical protein